MPFIAMPLDQAKEDELCPEAEYELRISDVQDKDSKRGDPMLQIMIDITNPPDGISNPAPIFHYISMPTEHDEPKSFQYKLRMIRRLLAVFNIPFEANGFNTEDLMGAEGECLVAQEERTKEGDSGNRIGTGEYSHVMRLPKFANEVDEDQQDPAPKTSRRRRG